MYSRDNRMTVRASFMIMYIKSLCTIRILKLCLEFFIRVSHFNDTQYTSNIMDVGTVLCGCHYCSWTPTVNIFIDISRACVTSILYMYICLVFLFYKIMFCDYCCTCKHSPKLMFMFYNFLLSFSFHFLSLHFLSFHFLSLFVSL